MGKSRIAQVIAIDTDTEETICQLINDSNAYIRAKGIRNAINDLRFKDKYGAKGYFVYLYYNEDDKAWYITEQVQHLKHNYRNEFITRKHEREALKQSFDQTNSINIVFGKESGIETFNRSKGMHKNGYAKRIDSINPNQKNGYGLKGDFISLTMSKPTELFENVLYLDCSRGKTYEEDIYHLFTVKDGKVHLIATNNSIKSLWDDIEQWFKKDIPLSTLWDIVRKETKGNKDKIRAFAEFLYDFCNNSYWYDTVEEWEEYKMVEEIIHPPLEEMNDVTESEAQSRF